MNADEVDGGVPSLNPAELSLDALMDHRGTMAFIDELLAVNPAGARCRATIRADNPFLFENRLPGWILVEYMAQSVAIFAGCTRASRGEEHRSGLLLGCRNLHLSNEAFDIGSRLDIEIEEIARFDHLGSFNGRVLCEGMEAATGTLSVYEATEWPASRTPRGAAEK